MGDNAFAGNAIASLGLSAHTKLLSVGAGAFKANSITALALPVPAYACFGGWVGGKGVNYGTDKAVVVNFQQAYNALVP